MSVNLEDRVFVSKLLRAVRIGTCSVREALLQFPKDTTDDSLVAVYHALIHYEADEDLRLRDALYKEEQDDSSGLPSVSISRTIFLPLHF